MRRDSLYKHFNIKVLPHYPPNSPDLNPQENVWGWGETELRKLEKKRDTFATFEKKVLQAVSAYPGSAKLVLSMAKRIQICLDQALRGGGGPTRHRREQRDLLVPIPVQGEHARRDRW